jgi:hypothetical protein
MNMKLATAIALLIILSFGVVGQAFAQTRTPGVKGGDNLVYNITTHWTSDNASQTAPDSLIELNNTKNYNVTISGTDGANITTTQLWNFVNGTQIPYLDVWNIESAETFYMSGLFEGIVGANLNVGDVLHPAGNDSFIVNQTITRNYASGARETNVVELSSPVQNSTTDTLTNQTTYITIGNEYITYYIDKATGVMVEQRTQIDSISPQESGSVVWTLNKTNLWDVSSSASAPISLSIIVVIVVVIVVVIAAVVVLRMNRKGHRKR